MKKILWTKDLSIGNTNIDNDHLQLLDVYNDMIIHIEQNFNCEELAKLLSRMTNYALNHFSKEEKYMRDMGYPDLKRHKKSHQEYNRYVAVFNYNLLNYNPPEPYDVLKFIKEWWINHIRFEDAKYESYKNEINSPVEYGI